jgi:HrpA-like RNA helicase
LIHIDPISINDVWVIGQFQQMKSRIIITGPAGCGKTTQAINIKYITSSISCLMSSSIGMNSVWSI